MIGLRSVYVLTFEIILSPTVRRGLKTSQCRSFFFDRINMSICRVKSYWYLCTKHIFVGGILKGEKFSLFMVEHLHIRLCARCISSSFVSNVGNFLDFLCEMAAKYIFFVEQIGIQQSA